MECSCEIEVDSCDDQPAVFNSKDRTARKKHTCCECGGTISCGDLYMHEWGMWDSKWHKYRTCSDCHDIRRSFFSGGWVYGSMFDDLWDYLLDSDGEGIPEDCIAGLTPGARDRVCEMIENWWEHLEDEEE